MSTRHVRLVFFAAIIVLAGCRPKQSAQNAPSLSPAPRQTVAWAHWMGMKEISSGTDAASLMRIWNLPESQKLELQTLDKSSFAPWLLLHRNLDTNAAALLRPLLDDVVSRESCLEIQCASNQPGELVFAIRLDDQRAALWQTNLARVLESLTGSQPVPALNNDSWSLKKHHVPNLIELARAGKWTLLGAAEDHNNLLDEFRSQIQQGQPPSAAANTNDWLAADVDLSQVSAALALGWKLSADTPRVSLAVAGAGTNVLSQATADFPQPLALDLQPWNIPTNLIDEKLSSFTLIRGFRPWLASSPGWTNLQIGAPPDQICFWALPGMLMQSYFTAPSVEASNEVSRLTDWVLQNQFPTNGLAKFGKSAAFNGLDWKGLPFMSPFLQSIAVGNQSYIYGGGMPNAVFQPLSIKVLQITLSQTNLLYHDSEITGPRIEQWLYMGQFARLVSHKAQLPFSSPAALWLKAISPQLGMSLTDISQTGSNQLTFSRESSIGFTGIELNLLADWLESPQFPVGLHTFPASPPKQQ